MTKLTIDGVEFIFQIFKRTGNELCQRGVERVSDVQAHEGLEVLILGLVRWTGPSPGNVPRIYPCSRHYIRDKPFIAVLWCQERREWGHLGRSFSDSEKRTKLIAFYVLRAQC